MFCPGPKWHSYQECSFIQWSIVECTVFLFFYSEKNLSNTHPRALKKIDIKSYDRETLWKMRKILEMMPWSQVIAHHGFGLIWLTCFYLLFFLLWRMLHVVKDIADSLWGTNKDCIFQIIKWESRIRNRKKCVLIWSSITSTCFIDDHLCYYLKIALTCGLPLGTKIVDISFTFPKLHEPKVRNINSRGH